MIELVTWWLALPLAHALLDGEPLPDLAPENTRVWVHDDPAPDGIGALMLDDRTRRRSTESARRRPLVTAGRGGVRAHPPPGQGALARRGRPHRRRPDLRGADPRRGAARCALAREAYPDIDLRTLELPGYALTVHVRSGCCLYYRIPKAKCWGCPLLTDDERRALTTS